MSSSHTDVGRLLAHGLGGRSDLPVPPWLATYAAGAVVLVSFFAVAALWAAPRFQEHGGGIPLSAAQRIVDSAPARVLLRVLGIALLAAFLGVAWLGPDDLGQANPAPTWFYVWFWVGLVPLSLACGPVWRLINPLRTIAMVLVPRRQGSGAVLDRMGHWPAVVSLLAFLWLELVYDLAASPRAVAIFVSCYSLVHVAAGATFGPRWFERGEGFEVYASMVARASIVGRGDDGALVLRNPLKRLAETPVVPDVTPVVLVVLGSTVFDGVSRSSPWSALGAGTDRGTYLALGTLGLGGAIAAVSVVYAAAMAGTRVFITGDRRAAPLFAHTLIPIAIGYTVAHYFSFALFQGQQGVLLGNDPLGRSWDLLGLAGSTVDYTLLPTATIAAVQIGAIVVGHVVAVVAAHDRSVAVMKQEKGLRGQYPMVVVMVAYTMTGIVLLAGG